MASRFLRTPLRDFKPYVVGKPIEEVRRDLGIQGRIAKLASNENPLGPSPKAVQAMKEAADQVSFYPEDGAYYFCKKLSEMHDIPMEQVIPAAGSVEILEYAALAWLEPDSEVVTSERSFAIYYLAPAKVGTTVKAAPMPDGYTYDLDAMVELIGPKTRIVFLANPNNPTGTFIRKGAFDRFMEAVPEEVIVICDEAYTEFISAPDAPDALEWLKRGRNVIVLRTLSKAHGLAGMRIGYGFGPEWAMEDLNKVRFKFSVNRLAQAAGMAALDDEEFLARTRELTIRERDLIRERLADVPGLTIPESQTNFLLIDTQADGQKLFEELQKQGLIVRPMQGYGMPKAIRVSIGLPEDNLRFVEAFRDLHARLAGE